MTCTCKPWDYEPTIKRYDRDCPEHGVHAKMGELHDAIDQLTRTLTEFPARAEKACRPQVGDLLRTLRK